MATTLEQIQNLVATWNRGLTKSYNQIGIMGGTVPVGGGITQLPAAIASVGKSPTGGIPGLCRINFNINPSGGTHYIPSAASVKEALLTGASIRMSINGGWTHTYTITSIDEGTTVTCMVPVSSANAIASFYVTFGDATENVYVAPSSFALSEGASIDVTLNTSLFTDDCVEIGRVQPIETTNGTSFRIMRHSADGTAVVESFGHYVRATTSDASSWVDGTGLTNNIVEMSSDGTITNSVDTSHNYETSVWPFNAMRKVTVNVAIPVSSGKTASQDFLFTECPIYYVKNELRDVAFETITGTGESAVTTTESVPCRIWWVCKSQVSGYSLPSWEKIWTLTGEAGSWTKTWTAKAANYMARYKSVDGTWDSGSVIQSQPSAATVTGHSRGSSCTSADQLNAYAATITGSAVFADGTSFAADSGHRRFCGETWLDYQAFRLLQYIQFGADVQATMLGVTSNNNVSGSTTGYQNNAEACFTAHADVPTFAIGTAVDSNPIVWEWILNPWGSEGDLMCDATTICERLANDTTEAYYIAMLDRAKLAPNSSDTETLIATGYERLSYNWAKTGKSGTYKRGLDSRDEYSAFNLPCPSDAACAINLGSVNTADGAYLGSYPAAGTAGLSVYMTSLSADGSAGRSLGPWSVRSSYGAANAFASYWGARLSLNLPRRNTAKP